MAFKWTCPYCNRDTTIGNENYRKGDSKNVVQNKFGYRVLEIEWISGLKKKKRKS